MPKRRSYKEQVEHFSSPYFGLCTFADSGQQVSDDKIVKSALVMVEGHHRDSNNRDHVFSAARVKRIAERTNEWLFRGGRVPWQRDHKKDQINNLGDLEGALEVRRITEADLPNPGLTDLVGKIGAFTTSLVGKGKDVVAEVLAGRIKTLSPGIDIENDIIREISATPTPAIVGLSTFKKAEARFSLTLAEAKAEEEQEGQLEDALKELAEMIAETATSIMSATEEDLQGASPEELLYQLVQDAANEIATTLGLGDANSPPYADPSQQYDPYQPPGMAGQTGMRPAAPVPGYLQKQQGMARMSNRDAFARFTLAGTEEAYRANFYEMPWRRRREPTLGERIGGAVGTAIKGAALIGGGVALGRYGAAGLRGAGRRLSIAKQMGQSGGGIRNAITGAGTGARNQLGQDLKRIGLKGPGEALTNTRRAGRDSFGSANRKSGFGSINRRSGGSQQPPAAPKAPPSGGLGGTPYDPNFYKKNPVSGSAPKPPTPKAPSSGGPAAPAPKKRGRKPKAKNPPAPQIPDPWN